MNNIYDFAPTNTLSSANFDILKIDGVEDPLIDVNKLATLDFEESYFFDSIRFINECQNELTQHKLNLYKVITESNSTAVIMEGFSDFFVKFKNIIDKFLKFIRSLFDRFITFLNKLVASEKYLAKHKNDLSDFKSVDEFKITGYNYTFSDNIPVITTALSWGINLFEDLFGDPSNNLTIDAVQNTIDIFNLETKCEDFRAKVIGKDGESISVSDFNDELFKIYRDGESSTKEINVDKSYVIAARDRFFLYNSTTKNINTTYTKIKNAYTDLQKQVQDMVKRNGDLNVKAFIERLPTGHNIDSIDASSGYTRNINVDGLKMSGELMVKLDTYVKLKTDQIKEYSDIHILAFAAKLDALKECYKQDRNTLYIALGKIQRTDNRRKEG